MAAPAALSPISIHRGGYPVFQSEAEFERAEFDRHLEFRDNECLAQLSFENARFNDSVTFTSTDATSVSVFHGDVSFARSTFGQRSRFVNLTFRTRALFDRALFRRPSDFSGVTCGGRLSFANATLAEGQVFDPPSFTLLSDEPVDCSGAVLAGVLMKNLEMGQFRLRDATGLDKADLLSVTWRKREERRRFPVPLPLIRTTRLLDVIREEHEARSTRQPGDFEAAERIYRQLRQSHTTRVDAPRISNFYYGEMEMRRLARRNGWGRPLIENMYRLLSGYGEDWSLPLIWFVLLLVGCAGLYTAAGLRVAVPAGLTGAHEFVDTRLGWPNSVGDFGGAAGTALLYSLLSAVLLSRNLQAELLSGWGTFVQVVETLIGPFLLGLAALAIRRRFSR